MVGGQLGELDRFAVALLLPDPHAHPSHPRGSVPLNNNTDANLLLTHTTTCDGAPETDLPAVLPPSGDHLPPPSLPAELVLHSRSPLAVGADYLVQTRLAELGCSGAAKEEGCGPDSERDDGSARGRRGGGRRG